MEGGQCQSETGQSKRPVKPMKTCVETIVSQLQQSHPSQSDFGRTGLDQLVIDLTETRVSLELCQRWLQNAHDSATDESFRRLIGDVMGDLHDLGSGQLGSDHDGSMDHELESLVLGALGSVQSAMELQAHG